MISPTTFSQELIFLQHWQNHSSWQRILKTRASATNPEIDDATYLANQLAGLVAMFRQCFHIQFARRPFLWPLTWLGVSSTVWLSPILLWPTDLGWFQATYGDVKRTCGAWPLVLRWLGVYFTQVPRKYVPPILFNLSFMFCMATFSLENSEEPSRLL